MKPIYSIFILFLFFSQSLTAQDAVQPHLDQAKTAHASDDLATARFELQEAMVELDKYVGKQILEMLPTELDGLPVIEGQDDYVAAGAGFTGLYVIRHYGNDERSIEFSVISHSPLLGTMNSFLNSGFGAFVTGRKRVRLDGHKGVLEDVEDSDPPTFNLNIPFDESMMIVDFKNYDSESKVLEIAQELPVKEIIEISK
jgi:hypothetical protein